jgi:hypothetical protein
MTFLCVENKCSWLGRRVQPPAPPPLNYSFQLRALLHDVPALVRAAALIWGAHISACWGKKCYNQEAEKQTKERGGARGIRPPYVAAASDPPR